MKTDREIALEYCLIIPDVIAALAAARAEQHAECVRLLRQHARVTYKEPAAWFDTIAEFLERNKP